MKFGFLKPAQMATTKIQMETEYKKKERKMRILYPEKNIIRKIPKRGGDP